MAKEGQSVNDLLAAFKQLDIDGDGKLSANHELREWLPRSPEPAIQHRPEMITTPIRYNAEPFNMEQTAKAIYAQRNPQAAAKEAGKPNRASLEQAKGTLALLDMDGDGGVTMQEILAADTDGDGNLSAAELKAAVAKAKAAKEARAKGIPAAKPGKVDTSPIQLVQWLNVTSGRVAPYVEPAKPKPVEESPPFLACLRCFQSS